MKKIILPMLIFFGVSYSALSCPMQQCLFDVEVHQIDYITTFDEGSSEYYSNGEGYSTYNTIVSFQVKKDLQKDPYSDCSSMVGQSYTVFVKKGTDLFVFGNVLKPSTITLSYTSVHNQLPDGYANQTTWSLSQNQ